MLVELDRGGWDASGAELFSHVGGARIIRGLGGSPPANQGGSLVVLGLNDAGQVFGYGYTKAGGGRRPFIWQGGRTTVLPTLDGIDPPWGAPARMNAHGTVVGTAYVSHGGENHQRVVVWRPR